MIMTSVRRSSSTLAHRQRKADNPSSGIWKFESLCDTTGRENRLVAGRDECGGGGGR